MRSSILTRLAVLLALIVGTLSAVTFALLPSSAALPAAAGFAYTWPVARGAFHVHSDRSDGTGTLDEIALAAGAAGLRFVVMTDHGNGTRAPARPAYRSNVLFLDGVEISTQYGHYIALGLGRAPYPLGGHPRHVIDDVERLGGFGVAAHPGSPKAALRWVDWDARFDGLEWLNADSEWRDEFWGSLGRVLLTYPFRPAETLAGLLDRPEPVLAQWDRLTSSRRVPALSGADAHARLGLGRGGDPYEDGIMAEVPAYEVSFRAFVNHAVLDKPLNGDAVRDAALVLSAIREGRVFTSIDGLAGLQAFEMKAISGPASARVGEYLDLRGDVVLDARIAAPPGTSLVLRRNGDILYEVTSDSMRVDIGNQPGVYRVEAHLPAALRGTASVPWVLANPIYVGMRDTHARAETAAMAVDPATARAPIATPAWTAEASEGSTSTLSTSVLADGTPVLEWRFALRAGERGDQYAAMHFPVDGGLAAHNRLQLRLRADGPRRVWAQLRARGPQGGERWGTSFYVDDALQAVELRFDDFRPLGTVSSEHPPLERLDSLLLVIDTLNSLPGSAGTLSISDLWFAR